MRIHYLQHVPFEDLGFIENWILENNHTVTHTKFFESQFLPNQESFDWLIILGGSMNIYDEYKFNWLENEKKFIKKTIQNSKIVLGICLGAQLIANCLGAKIIPNKEKEIGWFSIKQINNQSPVFNLIPNNHITFHWHGDTFDLPNESIHLLSSDGCRNQAFLHNTNVLGLQFHLEVSKKSITSMVENCRRDITTGKYVQSINDILANDNLIENNKNILFKVLDFLENTNK
ncbi:type 1 glutamine amidotransferase [Flavobacterium sp. Fl-77]|uniref:Type 1 glutamine amidotransferase n=1 Tax=Flavobacterium flavipigmentatum TaxID=2893884 RepID=A0AAJ2SC46_9FLAO|nr:MULTISPECIES: type 1 glutamine amidotransferase [unclassified Flavobacterium]MDX6182436.1 type 1 glutamine amidotransferase [Flavobacterium sp. Fl-33]MDX6185651.1 type 1 glutamine amidotransferase [Flavobacterium sp. Fl-77]UFH38836.1 type 1 glutamine amidotransferase [Flavobacterium sp. F-70]